MTKYLHVVMELAGEEYSPELSDDQMTSISTVGYDIFVAEWPGKFVRAAEIDYATGTMIDRTGDIKDVIMANYAKDSFGRGLSYSFARG